MEATEQIALMHDAAQLRRSAGVSLQGSMLGQLVKAVLERALEAELTAHLGYDKDAAGGSCVSHTCPTGRGHLVPHGLELQARKGFRH